MMLDYQVLGGLLNYPIQIRKYGRIQGFSRHRKALNMGGLRPPEVSFRLGLNKNIS